VSFYSVLDDYVVNIEAFLEEIRNDFEVIFFGWQLRERVAYRGLGVWISLPQQDLGCISIRRISLARWGGRPRCWRRVSA